MKILGFVRSENEELNRLIRGSFLPLLVTHCLKNKDDPRYLETARDIISRGDAEQKTRGDAEQKTRGDTEQKTRGSPAQAGPSRIESAQAEPRLAKSGKAKPSRESARAVAPPRSPSPSVNNPYGPAPEGPLPVVVIKRNLRRKKGEPKAAAATAALPTVEPVAAATAALPTIEPVAAATAAKGKGRDLEPAVSEGEDVRRKTFKEIDDECGSSDSEAWSERKPAPTRKRKAEYRRRVPVKTGEYHDPPCGTCERGDTSCMKDEAGGACVGCVASKRRCDYSRRWERSKKRGRKAESAPEVSNNNSCNWKGLHKEYRSKVKKRKPDLRHRRVLRVGEEYLVGLRQCGRGASQGRQTRRNVLSVRKRRTVSVNTNYHQKTRPHQA